MLQIKICIKPDRLSKDSNKIWESLSFWRNYFNNGAIWLQALICIDSALGMRCRLYGYQYSEIIRSLMSVYLCANQMGQNIKAVCAEYLFMQQCLCQCVPEWLWMTPTTYGRDFAYCLKSQGGVRGIYMSLWWRLLPGCLILRLQTNTSMARTVPSINKLEHLWHRCCLESGPAVR